MRCSIELCLRHVMLGAAVGTVAPAHGQCEAQWLPGEGVPGLSGPVYAMVEHDDGSGPSLFVGGDFDGAGDVAASNIARWDGKQWHAVGTGVDGPVYSLAVFNGDLIAGGGFLNAGGVQVNYVAAWNGTQWQSLDQGVVGTSLVPGVRALLEHDGLLVAGGAFIAAGGIPAYFIASWDGKAWSALDSGMFGGVIYALTVYKGSLIAGGSFVNAGGTIAYKVAMWDPDNQNWLPIGSGISTENGGVLALCTHDAKLIAGGTFTTAGGIPALRIAQWDGIEWSNVGAGFNSYVVNVRVFDNQLHACGWFATSGGQPVDGIARWDGEFWQPVAEDVEGYGGVDNVFALGEYAGDLIMGGEFTAVDSASAFRIARWDGESWHRIGGGMDSTINALASYNGDLVAGGWFHLAGGIEANLIARRVGNEWQPLDDGLHSTLYPFAERVNALTAYQGELVATGVFSHAGDLETAGIARWDGSDWYPIGGGISNVGFTLTVYDDELVVAGNFDSAGVIPVSNIARWNGEEWQSLGAGITVDPPYCELCTPTVRALTVYNGNLIAGGRFNLAGETEAWGIARWDGEQWHALGSGLIAGDSAIPVLALTVFQGDLIAAGDLSLADGAPAANIARWDGSQWHPLGAGLGNIVTSLTVHNGDLIAGGTFLTAGGSPAKKIARWDGLQWSPLEIGLTWRTAGPDDAWVTSLTVHDESLFAGGKFLLAGSELSAYWARWGCPDIAGDPDLDGDGVVGAEDLAFLLGVWGSCPPEGSCPADMNGDGVVGPADLAHLLANWS